MRERVLERFYLAQRKERLMNLVSGLIYIDVDDELTESQSWNLGPQQLRSFVKTAETRMLLQQHVDKPMHSLFYRSLEERGLSTKLTFAFLRSAGLKSETEGFIISCQDGVHNTLLYRTQVMGIDIPDVTCRACHRSPESLMHLLISCPVNATSAYIHQHNAAL